MGLSLKVIDPVLSSTQSQIFCSSLDLEQNGRMYIQISYRAHQMYIEKNLLLCQAHWKYVHTDYAGGHGSQSTPYSMHSRDHHRRGVSFHHIYCPCCHQNCYHILRIVGIILPRGISIFIIFIVHDEDVLVIDVEEPTLVGVGGTCIRSPRNNCAIWTVYNIVTKNNQDSRANRVLARLHAE